MINVSYTLLAGALYISSLCIVIQDSNPDENQKGYSTDFITNLEKADFFKTRNSDSTLYYIGVCEDLCLTEEIISGSGNYFRMASICQEIGYFDKANRLFRLATASGERENNPDSRIKSANWVGYTYSQLGDSENALGTLLENLKYSEEINYHDHIPETFMMIGFTYREIGDNHNAMKYFMLSKESAGKYKIDKAMSTILNEIGNLYSMSGDLDKGLEFQTKALELRQAGNDSVLLGYSYNDLANTYLLKNDFIKALWFFRQGLEINKILNNQWGAFYNYLNIAQAYNGLKQYTLQKEALDHALLIARQLNLITLYQDYYNNCVMLFESLGDYENLYSNFRLYITYRDSLNKETASRQIAKINASYNAEKKDLEIARKESENKMLKLIIIVSILALLSSAIVTILLIRSSIIKRKANHLLEEKNKEITRINEELVKSSGEIMERNTEIQNQRDEYLKLNATKDKFFSIIAHDLKNPLSGLLGVTEILVTEKDSLSQHELNEIYSSLNDSVRVTYSLLENLLLWSRSQTKSLHINREEIDFKLLAGEIMKLCSNTAKAKDIIFSDQIPPDLKVVADYNMLHTVLRNIINNAVKFTGKDGLVTINARRTVNFAEVSVTDTGIGISPSDIEKLFRIDVDTISIGKSSEKGSGIGLILCKEFVEMNGGTIKAESTPGKGSSFIFTVPLSETNE